MARGFITIELTPSADVATDDTMVFTYPSGYDAAADFAQNDEVLVVSGLGNVLEQAADTFTLSYGSSSVTVTYKDATSIPAGTKVVVQLPVATYEPLALGGVGASFNETTLDNLFGAVEAKINTLLDLSKDRDNVPRLDRN